LFVITEVYIALEIFTHTKLNGYMLKTRHIFLLFIPAFIIVFGAISLRVFEFKIGTTSPAEQEDQTIDLVPIFPQDPILGDKRAPTTIVAFEDFGCPSCKDQATLLDTLLTKHPGTVKIIWKSLSVVRFPFNTKNVHVYAYCANQQNKFALFKQFAFANTENLSQDVIDEIVIQANIDQEELQECLGSGEPELYQTQTESLARVLNIQSVPTIFLNNTQIKAPQHIEGWETLLGL
jgi:protein-disulfide isomerase